MALIRTPRFATSGVPATTLVAMRPVVSRAVGSAFGIPAFTPTMMVGGAMFEAFMCVASQAPMRRTVMRVPASKMMPVSMVVARVTMFMAWSPTLGKVPRVTVAARPAGEPMVDARALIVVAKVTVAVGNMARAMCAAKLRPMVPRPASEVPTAIAKRIVTTGEPVVMPGEMMVSAVVASKMSL